MKRDPHPRTALSAILILVLGGCAGARTSEHVPLGPGDQVRLTAPSVVRGEMEGAVQEVSQAELLLSVETRGDLVIPVDALRSLAIQRGTRRRAGRGALIGLGTSVVAFGLILASEGTDDCGANCGAYAALAGGVLVAGGTLVGTLVGLLFQTEVWEDQTLPLTVEGMPSGIRVGYRLTVGRRD